MRHPYELYIRLELILMILAVVMLFIILINGFPGAFTLLAIYLIALSLLCEAWIHYLSFRRELAGKQLIRAILLILLSTYFILQ